MIECLGLKSSGSIWVFCLVINLSRKNVFYSFLFEQLLDQTFLWSIDKIIKGLIIQWLADRIADWQSDWPTGWPTHWPLTETNVWFMDELIGHCLLVCCYLAGQKCSTFCSRWTNRCRLIKHLNNKQRWALKWVEELGRGGRRDGTGQEKGRGWVTPENTVRMRNTPELVAVDHIPSFPNKQWARVGVVSSPLTVPYPVFSFARPCYFFSPQSSSVIKSKMAAAV